MSRKATRPAWGGVSCVDGPPKMRPLVLVVENDAGTRKLLDVLLSRQGCEVDVVANGLDALLLLEKVDYDVAVLDLITPGASGADILEWMRTERPPALDRTVVMSSVSPQHLLRVQNAYPPVQAVRKPFELPQIVAAVETALHRRQTRAALTASDAFTRRSVTAGAKAGLLVRSNGDEVLLLHEFGYRGYDVQSWFPLSVNADLPLCTSVREAAPQWLTSLNKAAARYPSLVPVWKHNQSFALASVPVVRNGTVIGAAGWTFREPKPFDQLEQLAFTSIAEEALAAFQA